MNCISHEYIFPINHSATIKVDLSVNLEARDRVAHTQHQRPLARQSHTTPSQQGYIYSHLILPKSSRIYTHLPTTLNIGLIPPRFAYCPSLKPTVPFLLKITHDYLRFSNHINTYFTTYLYDYHKFESPQSIFQFTK